jgi:beta-lactamase regulating signal transducer with metallopeptidase domain
MEFSQEIVNAIGNTLFHSLWQGLILAAVTGLIIILTRSQKPALRYNLLLVAMLGFFASSIATFIHFLNYNNAIEPSGIAINALKAVVAPVQKSTHAADNTLLDQIANYVNHHNGTIVFIWILIVCARSLQLMIGLNGLKHLRSKAVFEIDSSWDDKLKNLAQQLGIKQAIGLAESGLIKVPMVIGHLKPLILLPIGLLTALPPKELEAILIHELAHIYRRDYLVNILQSLMEILFFFNPAVLWLSALIKAERENCCDDIAVGLTSSKFNYISALVSCQEYQLAVPAYAMAFSKKGQLKSRVKRLVHNNNQSLNSIEKSILAFCLVMASFGFLAFANEAKIEKVVKHTTKTIQSAITTVQKGLSVDNDSLKRLKVLQQLDAKAAAVKSSANLAATLKITQLDSIHQRLAKEEQIKLDSLNELNNLYKLAAEKAQLKSLSNLKTNNRLLARADSIRQRLNYVTDTTKKPKFNQKTLPRPPVTPTAYKPYKTQVDLSDLVLEELIKDGIITQMDSKSSFMLSKKELIVNGKKQSPEIYEKYKTKYIPPVGNNSWTLYRDYNSSRKTITASTD